MRNEAIIVGTPQGIRVWQLLAARSAIGLQGMGMKHSRMNVRKIWALHFGMKPTAKCPEVIARIEQELAALGHVVQTHAARTLKAGPL